jgi:hypothetical protein
MAPEPVIGSTIRRFLLAVLFLELAISHLSDPLSIRLGMMSSEAGPSQLSPRQKAKSPERISISPQDINLDDRIDQVSPTSLANWGKRELIVGYSTTVYRVARI